MNEERDEVVNFTASIARARRLGEDMTASKYEALLEHYRLLELGMNERCAKRGRAAMLKTWDEVAGLDQVARERLHTEVGIAMQSRLDEAWGSGDEWCVICGTSPEDCTLGFSRGGELVLDEEYLCTISCRNGGQSVWAFARPTQLD